MGGLALALSLALVAACGGGSDDDADPPESVESAAVDDRADDSAASADAVPEATAPATTAAPTTTTTPWVSPDVAVEPISGFGSVNVSSEFWAYTGWLGQVDPDRYTAQPVAHPPPAPLPGVAPLTGLPAPDTDLARPALYVKIGNSASARPPLALSAADLVYVAQVEGGYTRLAAVFHSRTPAEVGPVRSARSTDIGMLSSLNTPLLSNSGANPSHTRLLRQADLVDYGAASQTPREYFRDSSRRAPYNLLTDPSILWGNAADRGEGGTPPPHFFYRQAGDELPASAVAVPAFTVSYPSQTSGWTWYPEGGWRRTDSGSAVVDADGTPIAAANVVVAEVETRLAGGFDSAGSAITEDIYLGSGRGWVFTDGHMIEATWTKPTLRSVATWTTAAGETVKLTPGQTWIELAPAGSVAAS